jgi:hypothetical protein
MEAHASRWSEDILHEAVAAAVMAPSTHNSQPWRFRVAGKTLDLFADPDRHLRVIDPDRRQQVQSCGAALFNARVVVRAMGHVDEVTVMLVDGKEPDHLATLHIGDPRQATTADQMMLAAIAKRHTNRRAFLPRPVAAKYTDAMAADAASLGVQLVRIVPDQKVALGHIIDHADRVQLADPAFREELDRWLAGPGSRRRDGIPFSEKEYGSSLPFAKLRALRSPHLAAEFGQLEEERTIESPAVIVLGTRGDASSDWLAAGQALEAVLLRATMLGLSASFLNQALELPELRARVAEIVPGVGHPQMALRIGVPVEAVHHPAPRREVDDVIA